MKIFYKVTAFSLMGLMSVAFTAKANIETRLNKSYYQNSSPNFLSPSISIKKDTQRQPVNAVMSCQATVDKVLKEIRSKGLPHANYKVYGITDDSNAGNPTNRKDYLSIELINFSDENQSRYNNIATTIVSSKKLMNTWADSIVEACGGTAVVAFYIPTSRANVEYAIQANLTTKERKCLYIGRPLDWNEMSCP